ncbi:protein of unknown function [Candidatus Methylocalor cossyra]|uniref:Uncharacterized protein n=1 Tax=Candidatus Methylocalor cossyra TaxID=3108543 RepID=A0ABM9NHR9_9GAMM
MFEPIGFQASLLEYYRYLAFLGRADNLPGLYVYSMTDVRVLRPAAGIRPAPNRGNAPATPGWRRAQTLLGCLLQMLEGLLRVIGGDLGVVHLAFVDGGLKLSDALLKVGARLVLLRQFRVFQGRLGVLDQDPGMAHPAVLYGRLGMGHGLLLVVFPGLSRPDGHPQRQNQRHGGNPCLPHGGKLLLRA